MMCPVVTDMARAKGAQVRVPVAVSCRVLGFSRQAYYQWLANPVSQRDWDDAHLINAAMDLHDEDPGLGYRLIADHLPEKGITAGENRLHRLCKLQRIRSFHSIKNGSWKIPGPAVHDDLVQHHVTAEEPNLLWLTDITDHQTAEGKLYLCAVKDVFSNRIVGYSIDARMKASLAVNALRMAVQRRGDVAGCVVHSDRGSQGGFNWSSQHLDLEGVGDGDEALVDEDQRCTGGGEASVAGGQGVAAGDVLSGQAAAVSDGAA